MKVKALSNIETATLEIVKDEDGNPSIQKTIISMKSGETYDLDDDHAERLKKHDLVSEDPNAQTAHERLTAETTDTKEEQASQAQ